ncbi:hypothetical protein Syun_029226 [Stephania yunnanensis]|uniref:Uncharacterized protein n=1 Tax=Stephania yunnanensis TaxID=152371 RepID=A0AAP0HJ96_9MAGN
MRSRPCEWTNLANYRRNHNIEAENEIQILRVDELANYRNVRERRERRGMKE